MNSRSRPPRSRSICDGEACGEARIALGGVATVPWRAREAEAALKGKTLDERARAAAADAAFAQRQAHEHNAFKSSSASARWCARCSRRASDGDLT